MYNIITIDIGRFYIFVAFIFRDAYSSITHRFNKYLSLFYAMYMLGTYLWHNSLCEYCTLALAVEHRGVPSGVPLPN